MNILLQFAESLKSLMQEKNISPETLAKELNHNVYDIYHWISGKGRYMPSVANLVKLADHFKCSIEFLLGMADTNFLSNPKQIAEFSERFPVIVKENGYNYYKLAKATNMNNISYYDWIKGKAYPRIDSLIKISDVLQCSVDYLIGRE